MLTIVIKAYCVNDHVLMTFDTKVHSFEQTLFISELGGDYMIPFCRDEILSRFAGIPAV